MKTLLAFVCLFLWAHSASAKPRQRLAGAPIQNAAIDGSASPDLSPAAGLVPVARWFLGGNPTDMNRAWCGRFMRLVLKRAGFRDPGPDYDVAFNYRRIGRPGKATPGAIVYWGHHVGVIVQITRPGRAVVISGNDGPAGGRQVMERERSIAGAGFRHL